MNRTFKNIIAAVAIATGLQAQGEVTLQYVQDGTPVWTWGTGRQETYDIAIPLTNSGLVGSKIHSIQVPVGVDEGLVDCKIWISSELKLEVVNNTKVNVADLFSVDLPCPEAGEDGLGMLEYTFDEPFVIPDGGCFVGYSMTASRVDGQVLAKSPMALGESNTEDRFWIHATRSFVNWLQAPKELEGYTMLSVVLNNNFPENCASLGDILSSVAAVEKPSKTSAKIVNFGTVEVSSIDYTVELNGVTESYHADVVPAVGSQFLTSGTVAINIPACQELGTYDLKVTIDKVNGVENESVGKAGHSDVTVLSYIPKHKPLMEEYTGMWCGWCTRGWAAIEAMTELHPEDFICVAYHQNDPIQMSTYPDFVTNQFPSSYLDRVIQCDPYFGVSQWIDPFSIDTDWEQRGEVVSPVGITVEANLSEDNNTVSVNTQLDWVALPPTGEYRVGYVLTEDNMHSPEWIQFNNYVGYPENLEYIQPFIDGKYAESAIPDLPFNDVAVMNSDFLGVQGSIPSIEVGTPNDIDYQFYLYNAYNMNWQPIIQDVNNLNVVVFVLRVEGKFGEVINAEKCKVNKTTGVTNVSLERNISSVAYFDLMGHEVANPDGGMYIRVTSYSDGTRKSEKVMR